MLRLGVKFSRSIRFSINLPSEKGAEGKTMKNIEYNIELTK
jgi:hypothetical protein